MSQALLGKQVGCAESLGSGYMMRLHPNVMHQSYTKYTADIAIF